MNSDFHRLPGGDRPHIANNLQHGEIITAVDVPVKDFGYSTFKIELAKRAVVRSLKQAAKVVFRNNALSFVELEMKGEGFLDFTTDQHDPDFAKMADAAGLLGLTAETPEQVRPMLVQALQHDGPALVEVVVNRRKSPYRRP